MSELIARLRDAANTLEVVPMPACATVCDEAAATLERVERERDEAIRLHDGPGCADNLGPTLAWTNIGGALRIREMNRVELLIDGTDHPTQKPVRLMEWCLQQLPQRALSGSVLDPFMGSGSTGVACVRAGVRFTGIERDPAYFDIACRRIAEAYKQPRLFEEPPPPKPTQGSFFDDAA